MSTIDDLAVIPEDKEIAEGVAYKFVFYDPIKRALAGKISFSVKDDEERIVYRIDLEKDYQGKGYGEIVLRYFSDWVKDNTKGDNRIVARFDAHAVGKKKESISKSEYLFEKVFGVESKKAIGNGTYVEHISPYIR